MVVGGLLIKAAPAGCATEVEAATGGAVRRRRTATTPATHGALRVDQRFEPYPGVGFDDATYRGDAYPAFGWAACVAPVEVDLDTGEVHVRDVVAADDIGRVIHPVLAEGQVEGGTLQAVGYATIEEIKLRDGRYLNDRLATYIIPTALDAPADHDDPGRGAVRRRPARREGRRRAADGRRGARPSSRPSRMRPAPGSTTCRPARSGSWRRWRASRRSRRCRPARPSRRSPAAAS